MKVKCNYSAIGFISCIIISWIIFPSVKLHSQDYSSKKNDSQYLYSKGNKLEKLFPDSAIFYYQKSLDQINNKVLSNKESLLKIKALIKLGWIFHQQNKFSFALDFYNKAFEESNLINHDSLIAESSFNIAEVYLENGNYANSVNAYNKSREIFENMEFFEGIFWTDIGLGIIYRELGNTQFSKKHYLLAKEIATKNNREDYIAISYNNLGNLYKQIGEYNTAIEYLQKALTSFENFGEEKFISDCLEGMGEVYSDINNYRRALEYFERATRIAESLGDNYRLFSLYANTAKTFAAIEDNENALMYFSKTSELANSVGDKGRLSEILIIISDFYKKNGNKGKALENLQKSLTISRNVGDSVSIANALNSLSELYFLNNEYSQAYNYALESYQISSKNNLMKTLAESSLSLSSILELKGKYKEALYYHKIHNKTLDYLLNTEKVKILEEKEAKYNLEKIEREKLELENATLANEEKLQRRNNLILFLIIVITLLVILAIVYHNSKRLERKERAEKSFKMKEKIEHLNLELNERNRELTSKALLISQNNDVLKGVVEAIEDYVNNGNGNKKLLRKQKTQLQEIYEEKSWNDFIQHFEQVHPKFYKNLLSRCDELTSSEQKVCAFLKMKLNTKDISQITGQSTKAIEVMRSRIRKKLDLPHEESLIRTIQSI